MSELRTYLGHMDDDELCLTALEAYICHWQQLLVSGVLHGYYGDALITVPVARDIAQEMGSVMHDLADRKKRLRDVDFGRGVS